MRGSCIFLYDGRSFILRCNYVPVVFNTPLGIFLSECARFRVERDLSRHASRETGQVHVHIHVYVSAARVVKGQDAIKIPGGRFTISIITLVQPSVYVKNRISPQERTSRDSKICQICRKIVGRYANISDAMHCRKIRSATLLRNVTSRAFSREIIHTKGKFTTHQIATIYDGIHRAAMRIKSAVVS